MRDLLVLLLIAALTWGMWRALETWADGAMAWMWVWGMWIARELRAM